IKTFKLTGLSFYYVAERQTGKRVRLFHFLFEMLENPNMAHCLSWVPAAAGVFRFSSRNKDQVAALWGQRKGNKRLMTYQKMSRALRNYARSGEIFKVKKKLTYQFSRDTLMLLQKFCNYSFLNIISSASMSACVLKMHLSKIHFWL
uniref:Transcription factor Spi-C n=1 Tax=Neolamprologus brichardi TaxID=32507 RepID=A0A3Q4MJ48_NEOBR